MAEDNSMQQRGALGLIAMAVPILSVGVVAAAYAVATWYGYRGREAEGPLVDVAFAGCAEAAPLVEARAKEMGLETSLTQSEGGFVLRARLPAEERVQAQIPSTLAAPGVLEVHELRENESPGELLATSADIEEVTTYMDFLDTPKVAVKLNGVVSESLKTYMSTHLEQDIGYWLDGRLVTTRHNAPPEVHGELKLDLMRASDLDRIDFAASTGIILQHGPLPCPVSVAGVSVVDAAAR